ncbi:phage tail tape measure protein [Pseudomonas defluvii]|nr:phage tail tape measure protein [Pseudomonas defluvii]
MANKLALGLVIGGAVSATVGAAFSTVEGRIKKLEQQGNNAKVLKSTIGETMRLRDEWKKAHDSGSVSASGLLRKLESNLDSLRKQGVEVGRLAKEYQALGRVAKGVDLQMKGHQQIEQGKASLKSGIGQAVAGVGAVAVPTTISAGYQAIIRDIAIKADVANKPQEQEMTRAIIQTSQDTGMGRNDVADLVNQLVGAGMELDKALAYAPVAAKFAVGQGASGVDTANMIQALQQNAKISDPKVMEKALEGIALQGQAGSFEAADMAKWFPQLLAGMEKLGISGPDSVAQLGSMLQVQMKTAGSSDEAANNLKNWMEKIGSGDVVKAYKDAGIDYNGSLNTGIQNGMSTLESSFALAQRYVEATNPEQAKKMAEETAKISKETDPAKAQAMLDALGKALRTGDIFADMQVKAALTAYSANRGLYEKLKNDAKDATGILDKNLAERRETSAQMWAEMGHAVDDSMRAIGDAIRPATDMAAQGLTWVARSLTRVTESASPLVLGVTALGAGFIALKNVMAVLKIGKGMLNVARGSMMGDPKVVQRVFVTNAPASGGGSGGAGDLGDADGKRDKRSKGGKGRAGGGLSVGSVVKGAAAIAVVDAGMKAVDTYQNAETRDEKAEGYGEAAGGLAGTLAGAAAGAAVGSLVPVIGTAVGGVVGGILGSMGGTDLGGWLGKKLFGGEDDPVAEAPATAPISLLKPVQVGPAVPSLGATAQAFAPKAAPVASAPVSYDPRDPASKDPFLLPALNNKVRFPGAAPVRPDSLQPTANMGDVVRSMEVAKPVAEAVPAILKAPEASKPESKPEPPKIDQQFTFSPVVDVTVQGDVKDPAQLARDLSPHLQRLFDDFSRQAAARQMFDAPHVG